MASKKPKLPWLAPENSSTERADINLFASLALALAKYSVSST